MRTRTIIIGIAAIVVATLAACGSPDSTTGNPDGGNSTTAQAVERSTTAESYGTPDGYTAWQWDMLLESAAEWGVTPQEAEAYAIGIHREWESGLGDELCTVYRYSEDELQNLLIEVALGADPEDQDAAAFMTVVLYSKAVTTC